MWDTNNVRTRFIDRMRSMCDTKPSQGVAPLFHSFFVALIDLRFRRLVIVNPGLLGARCPTDKRSKMYLRIRKFSNVKSQDEVIKKVRDGLLPIMNNFPGFVSYYATKFEDGDIGGISVFQTKTDADKASHEITAWMRKELGDLVTTEPKLLEGSVLFSTARVVAAKSA